MSKQPLPWGAFFKGVALFILYPSGMFHVWRVMRNRAKEAARMERERQERIQIAKN